MYKNVNNSNYDYYSEFKINPFMYSFVYSVERNINMNEDSKIGAKLIGIYNDKEFTICSIEIKNTKGIVRFNEDEYINLIRNTRQEAMIAEGVEQFIQLTKPELEKNLNFNISNKNFFYDEYFNIRKVIAECSPKVFEKVSIAKMFNSLPTVEKVAAINNLAEDIKKTGVFNPTKGTLTMTVNASIREIKEDTLLAMYNFRRIFPGKEFNLDVANNKTVYDSIINKALIAIHTPIVLQEQPTTTNNLVNFFKEMRGDK